MRIENSDEFGFDSLRRKEAAFFLPNFVYTALNPSIGHRSIPSQATPEQTVTASTKLVLEHHLKCFAEGDLEGILADYSVDAVVFVPQGPLKGMDSIKRLFETILSEFGKPGSSFAMVQQSVDGEYAYILWEAETADNTYESATDTFVVRDGKIVAQSFAARITPRR